MKKIMIILMCFITIFSVVAGCTAEESAEVTQDKTNTYSADVQLSQAAQMIFVEYVEQGTLNAEEANALAEYLEANAPEQGAGQQDGKAGPGEMSDPLSGAVEAGIITQEQAAAIDLESIMAGQMGPEGKEGGMGQDTGMGQKTDSSMLSVDEANEIEAELLEAVGYTSAEGGYPIVDTNQTIFYSNYAVIEEPLECEAFYGQDATYEGNQASYTDNGDGTITDNVTGLMWVQDPGEKVTWEEAVENLGTFELAGYDDWRIPTIKELYSLVQFSGETLASSSTSTPYMDTDYFEFEYGDEAGEPRWIDSQMLTSTIYDSTTLGDATTVFGYNFADGRIKGYPITKDFYVYYVRGNTSYGQNQYVDNGDGTITDEATGLMWMEFDSGYFETGDIGDGTMDWETALEWAENFEYAGYDDWKLPSVKELQSLVDYTKSPDTTDSPAIDDLFYCTPIINAFGEDDYGFYWSSTSHIDASMGGSVESYGAYVVFGKGMGVMNNEVVDAHGAGSQRSDPKTGDREDYPAADLDAPQGDEQRVFNMVRLVREIDED